MFYPPPLCFAYAIRSKNWKLVKYFDTQCAITDSTIIVDALKNGTLEAAQSVNRCIKRYKKGNISVGYKITAPEVADWLLEIAPQLFTVRVVIDMPIEYIKSKTGLDVARVALGLVRAEDPEKLAYFREILEADPQNIKKCLDAIIYLDDVELFTKVTDLSQKEINTWYSVAAYYASVKIIDFMLKNKGIYPQSNQISWSVNCVSSRFATVPDKNRIQKLLDVYTRKLIGFEGTDVFYRLAAIVDHPSLLEAKTITSSVLQYLIENGYEETVKTIIISKIKIRLTSASHLFPFLAKYPKLLPHLDVDCADMNYSQLHTLVNCIGSDPDRIVVTYVEYICTPYIADTIHSRMLSLSATFPLCSQRRLIFAISFNNLAYVKMVYDKYTRKIMPEYNTRRKKLSTEMLELLTEYGVKLTLETGNAQIRHCPLLSSTSDDASSDSECGTDYEDD